jgi:hypothetical protein
MLQREDAPPDDYEQAARALYLAYCTHFPLCQGLARGKPVKKRAMRHMLLYYSNRFAVDSTLELHLSDVAMRRAVCRTVIALMRSQGSPRW